MADDDKLHVRCEACDHTWVAAYLPMVVSRVAKLMKGIVCPKCGAGAERIFLSDGRTTAASVGGAR